MVRFSILIPVYNTERYLRECLDSIVNQSFQNFEAILIDDGSIDNSGTICDEYALRYNNFKVIHQENSGVVVSRKRAFSEARGEYCVIVDSDDFIDCSMLEKLEDCIVKSSPDMILLDAFKYIDGHTYAHKPHLFEQSGLISEQEKQKVYVKLLTREMSNTLWLKVAKRSLISQDLIDEKYEGVNLGEDLLVALPLLTAANTFYYLRERLYFYRTSQLSLTQTFRLNYMESIDAVNKLLDRYLEDWGCDNGECLAGYRYLVDVYDLFYGAVRSRNRMYIQTLVNRYYGSAYFREKYQIANKQLLKFRQRWTVYAIYRKNTAMLSAIYCLLLFAVWCKKMKYDMIEHYHRKNDQK